MWSKKKVTQFFGTDNVSKDQLEAWESEGSIPASSRYRNGALYMKGWSDDQISSIGRRAGFFPKWDGCVVATVFTTKGGVLKSTLSLNLARTAALHDHKVLVIGLDVQGDVTTSLGHDLISDEEESLEEALRSLDRGKGLFDYQQTRTLLEDLIVETDLENLHLIPETPELVALNDSMVNINRREYWLKEKVIENLKDYYDLIIFDCSPNWNRLTTNALVASDLLISPLECKINNFRNFKVFKQLLRAFLKDMHLDLETLYVPTRYSKNRKLSNDIYEWYLGQLDNCTQTGIRESVQGEEAMALKRSVLEHCPGKKEIAAEWRGLFGEIHAMCRKILSNKVKSTIHQGSHIHHHSPNRESSQTWRNI
jgi:chromosome partitioning protein